MDIASRTTEGLPSDCPVCGKRMSVAPGEPLADIVCPHCGVLYFSPSCQAAHIPDDLKRLAEHGVEADTDDEGEVTRLRFYGPVYNDHTISELAKLKGVPVIDIAGTAITDQGAARLRSLLPDATIIY